MSAPELARAEQLARRRQHAGAAVRALAWPGGPPAAGGAACAGVGRPAAGRLDLAARQPVGGGGRCARGGRVAPAPPRGSGAAVVVGLEAAAARPIGRWAPPPACSDRRVACRRKIPQSVLVVIHTPALDVLLIERADAPGFWQSVTGSKDALRRALRRRPPRARWRKKPGSMCGRPATRSPTGRWRTCTRSTRSGATAMPPGVTHNTEHLFGLCIPRAVPVALEPARAPRPGVAALGASGRALLLAVERRGDFVAAQNGRKPEADLRVLRGVLVA